MNFHPCKAIILRQFILIYEDSYWERSVRGGSGNIVEHFFCEGRNSLKNMLSRQEITRSVCEEKNLDQKFDLTQKLEQFYEKKYPPPLKFQDFVKDSYVKPMYFT